MNELPVLLQTPVCGSGITPGSTELRIRARSTESCSDLVPALMNAIDLASGWVLHRQMTSASMLQIFCETQARALIDLYACLVQQGLQLSRDSHLLLTERCNSARQHLLSPAAILTLRLDVTLPPDLFGMGRWWQEVLA